MTDHAKNLRDTLFVYRESTSDLDALLAGHAAEVGLLTEDAEAMMAIAQRRERERDDAKRLLQQARADAEQLRQVQQADERAMFRYSGRLRAARAATLRRAWRYRRERDEALARLDGSEQENHKRCRELVEARADAETLRQENERLTTLLRAVHANLNHVDPEWKLPPGERQMLASMLKAALAAAQEPPADQCTHPRWCQYDRGHDGPHSWEPPAKGDDRDA